MGQTGLPWNNVGYTFHADSNTALTFGVFNLGAVAIPPTETSQSICHANRLGGRQLTGLALTSRPHSMVGVTAIAAANDTYALRLI